MLSKLWAKEAYPSKLIDEHFASNTALKRAIIKKSCTVERVAGITHDQRSAPVITQPFIPRTKFINLHNFE